VIKEYWNNRKKEAASFVLPGALVQKGKRKMNHQYYDCDYFS
jgi:hypothetical protein